jgi:hypothetical protein
LLFKSVFFCFLFFVHFRSFETFILLRYEIKK